MSEYPLISVITPTYNGIQTLLGTISSVLKQTYPRIQYIIIDDGSKKFDKEILEKFILDNHRENLTNYIVLANKKNKGIVKTLNHAIDISTGEYIFNLADDDEFCDENVVKDWVDEFEKSGAEIITAKRVVYDQDMKNILCVEPNIEHQKSIEESSPSELFEYMAGFNIIFGCATAKKRSLFDIAGKFDEKYRLIEDYSYNMQLLRKGISIRFFDREVVKYRIGGISDALKVNGKYLKESKKIFTQEILPFVKDKQLATINFKQWIEGVRFVGRRNELETRFKKYPKNKFARFFIYIGYSFRHPIHVAKKYLKDPKIISKKL